MCKRRKTFILMAKKTIYPPATVVKANLIKLNMKPSIKQVKKMAFAIDYTNKQ